MRISYYTDTREIGGAEQNLVDMARVAIDAGHEVHVLAPQPELVSWLAARVPSAEAAVVGTDAYFDAGGAVSRLSELVRQGRTLGSALRRRRTQLLHVNNGGFPGSDLCRLAPLVARFAAVPRRIMSVHSDPWPRNRLADPRVQAVADALVWPNVEAVVCPSKAVADGLVGRRGAPRRLIRSVHYGVDAPQAHPDAVADIRGRLVPDGQLLVGMVSARPVPEKGYDVFARALQDTTDEIRGVLIGPNPPGLADQIAADLGARLVLEGEVRPIGSHYHAVDLLVVPSTAEECMPLVILEAMGAAKPVAGSRLSGIPEAILDGETGWTFPTGDAAALSAIMRAAAQNRDALQAMGTAGRARWEELFRPEIMRADLLTLYEGLDQTPSR